MLFSGLAVFLRIAGYVFLASYMILVFGRYIGLPIFIALVVSPSMVPTIYPGDMVLFIKSGFDVGDVVIWCSSAMFCVVHRVVEINGSVITTKGDANPIPDKPVPAETVKGVAKTVIPRWLWIPAASMLVAFYLYRRLRTIPRSTPGTAFAIVLGYAAATSIYIFIIPASPILVDGLIQPSMDLRGVYIENNTVYAVLIPRNASIASIEACRYIYGSHIAACTAFFNSSVIWIEIPSEVFRVMNIEGIPRIDLNIVADLTLIGGRHAKLISWNYTVFHTYREPVIEITGGRAVIRNPNPGCLDVNITAMVANRAGEPWNISSRSFCLDPWGSYELDLSGYRYAVIKIEYILLGKRYVIQRVLY